MQKVAQGDKSRELAGKAANVNHAYVDHARKIATASPDAFKLALGRRYNRTKKAAHRPKELDQIDPVNPQSTAAKLAAEHSVSEATVKRAMVANGLRSFYDAMAKERQVRKPVDSVVVKLPQQNDKSRELAGKAANVSGTYVDKAKQIATASPKIAQDVLDGAT